MSRSVLWGVLWILSARHWFLLGEGAGRKHFSRHDGGLHPAPRILVLTVLLCHNNGTLCPTVLAEALRISWALCPRDSQLQLCPVEHTTKVQGPASSRRLHLSLPTAHQHWGQSVVHWVFISDISYPWLFSLWLRAATPLFSCQEIVPVHGIYRGRLCYMTHSQEISSFMAWHFTLKNVQGWNLKLFSGGWEQRGKFVNSIRIKSSVYRILVDGFIILRYKQL